MSTFLPFIFGSRVVVLTFTILLLSLPIEGLGWRNAGQPQGKLVYQPSHPSTAPVENSRTAPDIYATALMELKELESEPLCHRVAARLLVGNCQLLDGQNDATVLTDTGRAARDFVDFFAASLAICDLERANFDIPAPCFDFRENVLANLPAPSQPQLHVGTAEIDACLEGLAKTDSAWSTWVSYRHKALRFCEAARAENEKDQQILLHQKLASVLKKVVNRAEDDIRERSKVFELVFQKSSEDAKVMTAHVEKFETISLRLNKILSSILSNSVQAQTAVFNGMEGARSLEKFMGAILSRAKLREERMHEGYEAALKAAATVASQELAQVTNAVNSIALASVSLQKQLATSEDRVLSIVQQQEEIWRTMETLQELAEGVLEKQRLQSKTLRSTHNQTLNILSSLEAAATSIGSLRKPLEKLGNTIWWPYIICPVATLTLGSYGLEPSVARNLFLLGAGEFAGFLVSFASSYQDLEIVNLSGFVFSRLAHSSILATEANSTCINTTYAGSTFDT